MERNDWRRGIELRDGQPALKDDHVTQLEKGFVTLQALINHESMQIFDEQVPLLPRSISGFKGLPLELGTWLQSVFG